MSDVTIECPYCGEEMHVKVHRQIMKAEVVK